LEPPRHAAFDWIKSSRCHASQACVELARAGDVIAVRSSQEPDQHIYYTHAEISAWIEGAKRGDFDHLVRD
jgi:uncharacterized protein DUF397